ncbi:MAG TPA: pentapeptide repeat-containing protein [Ignavibacteria bacterium]
MTPNVVDYSSQLTKTNKIFVVKERGYDMSDFTAGTLEKANLKGANLKGADLEDPLKLAPKIGILI